MNLHANANAAISIVGGLAVIGGTLVALAHSPNGADVLTAARGYAHRFAKVH